MRCAVAAMVLVAAAPAFAADRSGQAPCPAGSAVTSGSSNVTVGGKQAARAGDTTGCGSTVVEGYCVEICLKGNLRAKRDMSSLKQTPSAPPAPFSRISRPLLATGSDVVHQQEFRPRPLHSDAPKA